MTHTNNRLLDDLARLMTDAAGMARGARSEVDGFFRTQAERILSDLDMVSREEFEAVRLMAQAAREDNARLEARIAALEAAGAKPKAPRAKAVKAKA
jgi:BMFP domain-containing protein YqiC